MKFVTCLFFLSIFFSKSDVIHSQDLLSVSLLKSDHSQGVFGKYELTGMESFYQLILYKDNTFRYNSFENIIGKRFSEGWWKRKDDLLILNSTVRKETLPIRIDFSDDSIKIPRTKVHWVYNSKGKLIEDALFFINDDSCVCSSLMDTCTRAFEKISRIKLIIGDVSSTWVNVTGKEYRQLKITVLSDINFSQYVGFTDSKFQISKRGLNKLKDK
jgi:hypothetical protein